jgi:hypothetical protein
VEGEADLAEGEADLVEGEADLVEGEADLVEGEADLVEGLHFARLRDLADPGDSRTYVDGAEP